MKYVTVMLAFLVVIYGCKPSISHNYCHDEIKEDHVGFMLSGGILDKYNNGATSIFIVHIVDPQDWQHNEYFTGKGFSTDQSFALRYAESDTCELKEKYFEYLNGNP